MKPANAASSGVVRPLRLWLQLLCVLACLASAGTSAIGCKKKSEAAAEAAPEVPAVTDATTGLLLTWIDEKGEFHVEQTPADVPIAGRESVKVRDPARDPLSGNRIFIADLRTAAPDGSYPVRVAEANELEDIAVTRRAKHGIILAPREAGAPPVAAGAASGEVAGRPAVIIYGASWCGPCHQAAAYLKGRGIAFVEHDIEKDSSAAREMQAKLAKAGARGGSIPVLDVRGRILIGFDQRAVDQALATAL